jgi:serine protease Do
VKLPDWLIYTVVLVGVVYGLMSRSDGPDANAPHAPPVDIIGEGSLLPAPSIFDEEVLVDADTLVGPRTGTAFAIGTPGHWLTAKHVIDGCPNVAIAVGRRRYVPVRDSEIYRQGDLAVLRTEGGPAPVALDLRSDLRVGQIGYHFGYPQGVPGEVTSRLLSRSRLTTRGRYQTTEPVLAWAEAGRTRGLIGSLAGISGGPVYDSDGEVIGVTVAESPRRGRIYTTAPRSIETFLPDLTAVEMEGVIRRTLSQRNYGGEADRLRRNLTIVPVVCRES